jgi:hypothetical protein
MKKRPPCQKTSEDLKRRLDALPVDGVLVYAYNPAPFWTPSRSWFYAMARKLSKKLHILVCPDRFIVFRLT